VLLLFGLIGVPLLIWVGGNRVLGPYTHEQNLHAGPLALLQDFFLGLLHGSAVFWVVALGPAALVLLVRLFIALVRAMPSTRDQDPPAPPGRRTR
jgi:TctA family transporter